MDPMALQEDLMAVQRDLMTIQVIPASTGAAVMVMEGALSDMLDLPAQAQH